MKKRVQVAQGLACTPTVISGIDSWDWNTCAPDEAEEAINRMGPNNEKQVNSTKGETMMGKERQREYYLF